MTTHADFPVRPEDDRIHRRAFWLTAAGAIAVIVISVLISGGILRSATDAGRVPLHHPAPPQATPQIGIVEQTLFDRAQRGLDLRDEQEQRLHAWGWVDRAHGVARIPIERAMDLVAREQATAQAAPPAAAPSPAQTPSPDEPASGKHARAASGTGGSGAATPQGGGR